MFNVTEELKNQYVTHRAWHYLVRQVSPALCWLHEVCAMSQTRLSLEYAKLHDASRAVYSALLLDFIELTHEASELWEEVKRLRVLCADKDALYHKRNAEACMYQQKFNNVSSAWGRLDVENCALSGRIGALVEDNNKLRHDRDVLKARSPVVVPTLPCAHTHFVSKDGEPCEAVPTKRYEELLRKEAEPTPPIWYGIDIGAKDGDHTVITVKQGGRVVFTIDATANEKAERARRAAKSRFIWLSNPRVTYSTLFAPRQAQNIPRTEFAAGVEARVAAYYDSLRAVPAYYNSLRAPAMVQQEARKRYEVWQAKYNANPRNRNKAWTKEMDEELEWRYREGFSLWRLAIEMSREWEAVLYRLGRLSVKFSNKELKLDDYLDRAWCWFFKPDGLSLGSALKYRK